MIAQNPHALAIIAALEAAGLAVGDGVAPTSHPGRFVVLHMIPGGEPDGTAADPDEWADGRFELVAVGRVPSEARWVADAAQAAVCAPGAVEVAGRSIQRVRPLSAWGETKRDDDLTPPLYYATRVFGIFTFAA